MTLQWGDYRAGREGDVAESRSFGWDGTTLNVLSFDGHYMHCGQPMTRFGAEMHRILDDRYLLEALGLTSPPVSCAAPAAEISAELVTRVPPAER